MRITYSIVTAKTNEKCYECGGPATITLVADNTDPDGYTDEVSLCEDCAEKREV